LANVTCLQKLYNSLNALWFKISKFSSLKEHFSRRFSDFQALDENCVLLTTPFSYERPLTT